MCVRWFATALTLLFKHAVTLQVIAYNGIHATGAVYGHTRAYIFYVKVIVL